MTSTPIESVRLPGLRDEVPVVFADASLLVLDKPAGLLVAPDRWDRARANLSALLRASIAAGAPWCKALKVTYAANAHRIDADTSGLLVCALNREALSSLVEQFRGRTVDKQYLAIVHGAPSEDAFAVDLPIRPDDRYPGLVRTGRSAGKAALTRFEVVERYRGYALVRARPETGRQHQVRVHLKAAGHSIVGDADYGGHPLMLSRLKRKYRESADGERPLIARQALHAHRLRLAHPATGAALELEAEIPKDIAVALKYLRRYGM
jgi:RluA family pseudouridine synthase